MAAGGPQLGGGRQAEVGMGYEVPGKTISFGSCNKTVVANGMAGASPSVSPTALQSEQVWSSRLEVWWCVDAVETNSTKQNAVIAATTKRQPHQFIERREPAFKFKR